MGDVDTRLELLAPAGDWQCAKAAVENGADAIYFGLSRFNARIRARNFTEVDLPRLMEYLHGREVRGYVSFNTLVFANELQEAQSLLRAVIAAGADAALVQDVGIARLIRRMSPDFPIHASTQMTITSAAGVAFARELGCHRVVLARECSIRDVARIQAAFRSEAGAGAGACLPLETFVHGALCVAYSGQCLTSESLGGRSANRGECAQACRMPYELVADGRTVSLGDRRYLLSPRDLAAVALLPALAKAGVTSFKIEGRLKTPEYVASITRIYREAIDSLAPGPAPRGDGDEPSRPRQTLPSISAAARYEMEMAFSRGLHTGWLEGVNNQELVHGRYGKKRGVFLGRVARVCAAAVEAGLEGPLKPGDGVVFDAGHPDEEEEGGRVYSAEPVRPAARGRSTSSPPGVRHVVLTFGRGDIDFSRVQPGDRIWKTSDPELTRRVRQTCAGDEPRFQRALHIEVRGAAGQPLTLMAWDDASHRVELVSAIPLAAAEKHPLTPDRLRRQLGRLGGTPFKLGQLMNRIEGAVMLPVSELNRLRREAVSQLHQQRAKPLRWTLRAGPALPALAGEFPPQADEGRSASASAQLIVLVRSLEQLEAALDCGVNQVYCEFEDPKRYRAAVARFRERRPPAPAAALFVAPPRITKPGEEWMLNQVRSSDADGCLVRNFDHLTFFAGCRCVGDFSLNVANPITAAHFIEHYGFERLTASYDLDNLQLEALLQAAPPQWFEITIHQHMPMFHMEHCLFCAFLSSGTDYTNCGRPCDRQVVELEDRVGARHPVKADAGCRNTVFNALAQTGAEYVARFIELGARHFRIEFLNETRAQAALTIQRYQQLLRGETTGAALWRELKLRHRLGVTRGSLDTGERAL